MEKKKRRRGEEGGGDSNTKNTMEYENISRVSGVPEVPQKEIRDWWGRGIPYYYTSIL